MGHASGQQTDCATRFSFIVIPSVAEGSLSLAAKQMVSLI